MVSPEFTKLHEFMSSFTAEEAIFFGGSFNPWHQGHKECLKLCPHPERVIVIPDHNPQKDRHSFAAPTVILEHLKTETQGLCFGIFDGFMTLGHANPSYFWLESLHLKRPHLKLSLLLGADSFQTLQTWVEAEKLLNLLTHLYVVPRLTDRGILREQKQKLEKINPKLIITILASHEFENLSSTAIRNK